MTVITGNEDALLVEKLCAVLTETPPAEEERKTQFCPIFRRLKIVFVTLRH